MAVTVKPFGVTKDGRPVESILLTAGELETEILTYGAVIRTLKVPDREGRQVDVVLGYAELAGYEENGGYLGALVGRYANRIAGAQFSIDGRTYHLTPNEGTKQLHGGPEGYSRQVFSIASSGESWVTLSYRDADGANGYPGNLAVSVTYTLTPDGLEIAYTAEADKPTFCNLTNHSYFNLNGGGDVLGHLLSIKAYAFTPIDKDSIPTMLAEDVTGTPFDFRQEKAVGRDICLEDPQLQLAGGYDHNFVLGAADKPRCVARVKGEKSGIVMEAWTDQPGVQLYTANGLATDARTKAGRPYGPREALCLETQIPPDSPNHPEWGDVVLRPGETYQTTTAYRFSVES